MSPLCPPSADYEDLVSELKILSTLQHSRLNTATRETILTDLQADSVAVDDEPAADEAPVDGGDVPLVFSEVIANAI